MASNSNNVVFQTGKLWDESLAAAIKDTPNIVQKILEFKKIKEQNPMSSYGTNDKPFSSDGIFKQYLPKARKAHLNRDIAIVYELSGKNPTVIKLYGVFTHANLGTGQPANIKIQKNMGKKLAMSESQTENYSNTGYSRLFIQDAYIRVCKDSGFKMDAIKAAQFVGSMLKIAPFSVYSAFGDMDNMLKIADGTHPYYKKKVDNSTQN